MSKPTLKLANMLKGTIAALLVSPALASFGANLNYRSPSLHHPGLGISLRKVVKRNDPSSSFNSSQLNFTHGVASGDPYPNSVILWTRCSPVFDDIDANVTVSGVVPLYNPVPIYNDTDEGRPPSNAPVCLNWAVGTDANVTQIVSQGTAYTSSDVDYTVKVEASGLQPFTRYYYQFSTCDSQLKSMVGRTKTTPNPTDATTEVGIAVYSCSNFPFGFFNAYGNPVRKDSVDYVIHLGDYIYEYANGDYGWGQSINRIPLPDREIFTLYDYRKRHATYRTDQDLVLSHSNYPWIPVWDDHEVADNTYRDGSSELNNTEASFIGDGGVSVDQRKMNAVRAYFEWMPIRQVEMDDSLRIWRSFAIGSLVDLIMLDTRQYDRSITDLYWNTDYIHAISNDAGRSMMGPRQEYWFYDSLKNSAARGATWRLIGSQTVFSRLNESEAYGNVDPLDYDAWDGYQVRQLSVPLTSQTLQSAALKLTHSPFPPKTGQPQPHPANPLRQLHQQQHHDLGRQPRQLGLGPRLARLPRLQPIHRRGLHRRRVRRHRRLLPIAPGPEHHARARQQLFEYLGLQQSRAAVVGDLLSGILRAALHGRGGHGELFRHADDCHEEYGRD